MYTVLYIMILGIVQKSYEINSVTTYSVKIQNNMNYFLI